jgi:hypothetical protein
MSDQHISVVQDMKNSKEDSAKLWEQQRVEHEESRKRKAAKKEATFARRAVEQQEAQHLKNERLTHRAEALAIKVVAREEAARAKATRTTEVAAARLAKAVERYRLASDRREALLHCSTGAAERAGGHQAGAREGTPTTVAVEFAFPSQ